jgi:hypothetical protein
MTDDYSEWLDKIQAAVDNAGSIPAIARWIAPRLELRPAVVDSKLRRMLAKTQEPRGSFIAAVNAWLAHGCPTVPTEYDGTAGAIARAAKLAPETRQAIAKAARAARKS